MSEQRRQARRVSLPGSEPEPEILPPPSVAPVLAVVGQWTGREARALRVALRMSLDSFARLVGAGRSTVTDLERGGARMVPSWGVQNALDEALRQASDDDRRRFGMRCDGNRNVWVSDSVPRDGNGGATDRGTTVKTAFMPPGSASDMLEQLTTGGELMAITYRYRRMDQGVASWRLIEPAASHLRLLDELYRDVPPSTCRRRLAAAVSEAAGLAAWLCFDMDDAARAHAYYRHAVRAAAAAGDPLLGGYMLGSMGWLAIQVGDGAAALELIQAARSKISPVDPETPATSCAWLAVHEALAQATLRDTRKALTLLDRAGDAVARAVSETPVWPWLYPFSPAKLATFSGSCSLRLGRADEARATLQEALRLRPAGATARATVLIDLASAHLMRCKSQVDIDEVGQLVSEAAGIAANKGSARLWRQVRETRTSVQPWASSRAVRKLDEQLRSYSV